VHLPRSAWAAVALLAGILLAVAVGIVLWTCEPVAYGCDEVCEVAAAIRRLQPATSDERAERLAGVFTGAGHETRIDPLLLVAIAMRESSLSEDVEQLERLGARGERGLLQIHGAALRVRPEACGPELEGAHCQVYTGALWLARVRDACEGSTWRWVAAYGRSRCPSEAEARADRAAAIAASYYALAGGREWR